MAGTRSSTRNASQGNDSSPPSATPTNGTKRKADAVSPTSNRKKQQKTLEEVIPDEAQREEVKAAIANEGDEDKVDKTAGDQTEKQGSNGDAGKVTYGIGVMAGSLTGCLAATKSKTEENGTNGANGHDDSKKPNAFDKIQADENDEGTTGAKVRKTRSIPVVY